MEQEFKFEPLEEFEWVHEGSGQLIGHYVSIALSQALTVSTFTITAGNA